MLSDFDSEQKAIVEDGRNFIVVHPDYLVSSTAVVSMVFCRRKAVLNEWFRAQDSFNVHMMIGTLIHQLFQEVAVNNRRMPREEIEYRLKDVLKKNSNLKEMYKFKEELTEEQLWKELLEYVPTIDDWMQKYHTTKMASASDHRKPDNIRITGIRDIEENVWCPRFGIKGKVDITAEAQMRGSQRRDSSKTETRVLPLELKTGRPTFSIEHQSQVILYGMMLKDRHLDTYGGLLFYLKTGDMKEIPTNVKSEQGLIQVRNELVHHLVNPLDVDPTTILKGKNYRMAELPEPLGESRLCSKCPHLQTCSLLYQTRNPLEEKASPSYEALSEQSVIHLNKSDKDYFTHWLHLLFLESSLSRESTFQLKNIWTSTARHRSVVMRVF